MWTNNFWSFSLINSSQTDHALPLKLPNRFSSPSSCISGTACFIIILWFNFFACHGDIRGNHFARNLHKFGFAYLEELEMNQWIALDILSSQSECAKNTIHCFNTKAIYKLLQVRSNHERLVTFEGDSSSKEKQKDSPLKLKSTAGWKQRGKKEATCSVFNWIRLSDSGYVEFT